MGSTACLCSFAFISFSQNSDTLGYYMYQLESGKLSNILLNYTQLDVFLYQHSIFAVLPTLTCKSNILDAIYAHLLDVKRL